MKTLSRKLETPDLTAARQAEEARRAALKPEASKNDFTSYNAIQRSMRVFNMPQAGASVVALDSLDYTGE